MKVAAALNELKYTHSLIIDCIPTNAAMVVQDCLTYRNARDLQNYLTQGTAGYTYNTVLVKVAELISYMNISQSQITVLENLLYKVRKNIVHDAKCVS